MKLFNYKLQEKYLKNIIIKNKIVKKKYQVSKFLTFFLFN